MADESCTFCELNKQERRIVAETDKFLAVRDNYPVSPGHTLLIPKRHLASFFELSKEELDDLHRILSAVRDILGQELKPDGFNIGINDGKAAGQTIFHLHVHVIPRYIGDVEHPEGGIRNILSSEVRYP